MRSFTIVFSLTLSITSISADLSAQTQAEYENAPELNYTAVADPLSMPEGTILGNSSAVAFDPNGHLYVFHRGPNPLAEFDASGKFIRSFGDEYGIGRSHGLRIDEDGNLWITDVGRHTVAKLSPEGEVLMMLGVPDQAGMWDETSGERYLSEPNDIAFGPAGEIFIVQGHGNGEPGVLKFDKDGRFLTYWGGQGSGVGEFDVAHSIVVDSRRQVHVADRENQRIQVFDLNGDFIRQSSYAGLPCGLVTSGDEIYMVSGDAGQIVRLDADGRVVSATGQSGDGPGRFGEAHYIAISPMNEIFVADPASGEVEKFVRR